MKTYEPPVITKEDEGTVHERIVERHPSFAIIGASRVHGGNGLLFGSDFRHNDYITIHVKPAEYHRHLSNDWYHGKAQDLIEVNLSEAQWATFISTLNNGQGVPCTLTAFDSKDVPGIAAKPDRQEQFTLEMSETFGDAIKRIGDIVEAINASSLSQKKKDEIISYAKRAVQEITKNTHFVTEQFGEHIENTVEKAKIEISAYMTGAIARAGLKALQASPEEIVAPLQLTETTATEGETVPE
jgi:hypothetical protein